MAIDGTSKALRLDQVFGGLAVVWIAACPVIWHYGYRHASQYAWSLALTGLVVMAGAVAGGRAYPRAGLADGLVRLGVITAAVVVACAGLLGSFGHLTPVSCTVLAAACAAASLALPRSEEPDGRSWPALPVMVVALVGALLIAVIGYGLSHSPQTLYDALSYHLFFPARWIQEHRLSIIPTPFSDEAQAYAPANGELVFAWLMLPLHGDLAARIGQVPFGLLAAAALYGLARRIGASPAHAIYPAAFYLFARPVVEQMTGANVDLICAALFLAGVLLAVVAIDTGRPRDWLLCGVAFGLFVGTKYVALVYAPVVVALVCARGFRRRALWTLPGIAVFGLPWYVRNWFVAGSPIYPQSLQVAGHTVAQGAFTRAAMFNSVFHVTGLRLLGVVLARALGPTLVVVWIPAAVVGAIVLVRRRRWWPDAALVLLPVVMVPLCWLGVPVNIDARFFLPALGPALLPLAFVFDQAGRRRAWNGIVHVLYACAMVWIAVGSSAQLATPKVPWFMDGWLALDGIVDPRYFLAGLVLVVGLAAVWLILARWPWTRVPIVGVLCATACATTAIGADRWCRPYECDLLETTSAYLRDNQRYSWAWLDDHVSNARIAYTGNNLPYPLTGRQLTNRVYYVNIDGHLHWRFDDYDRAERDGTREIEGPRLATSSGELLPVPAHAGAHEDASRPRYERMEGFRAAWIANLEALGINRLYVAVLSPYDVDDEWHNAAGFPIEDEWAKADTQAFPMLYENSDVHIYGVRLAGARP